MTPFTLYLALYRSGLLLSIDGEKLLVTPADKLTDELRLAIRQYKPELVELLQSAHHTTGRLLDWVVDLDPHTTVATAIRFRTASLALDQQAPANHLLDKAGEEQEGPRPPKNALAGGSPVNQATPQVVPLARARLPRCGPPLRRASPSYSKP